MDARSATPSRPIPALTRLSVAVRRTVCIVLRARPTSQRGMTLLELLLAMVMVAILMAIAYAGYRQVIERVRVSRAIGDIGEIQLTLDKFELNRGVLPDSLAEIRMGGQLDPWGAPYQYLNLATVMGLGAVRKDRNLVPINTDFDLYSMGPDGASRPPLTAGTSRDDIVRANDGSFVGKAEDY